MTRDERRVAAITAHQKGSDIMVSLRSITPSVLLIPLPILTVSVVGCAKCPVGITATTPAPTGAASPKSLPAAKEGVPQDADILVQNARWMKANPADLVLIEGHADECGTNEYNLVLGNRRAQATKDFLVAQGVQATGVTTISYGEERPLCTEHNETCWVKNRRAHFLVKPQ
jgi:peptidoglycan-associated lipoprotein